MPSGRYYFGAPRFKWQSKYYPRCERMIITRDQAQTRQSPCRNDSDRPHFNHTSVMTISYHIPQTDRIIKYLANDYINQSSAAHKASGDWNPHT